MSEFYKGLRLPLAEAGKLLMLNEDNKIVSSQVTENDILNRTKLATVAPENPVEGDIYYDAENDKIMAYTGTAWVMQDRIINLTTDYEGTFAGSDCFFVDTKGSVTAGETTFYVMFHRDAVGIGNCDLAVNAYGALYLCNPDGTRIVASDIKAGTVLECIVKDTGGVPKYKAYVMTPIHHIVNDLTTGGVGYVLSAEQGKVLNEKIDTTKTELETNIINVETTLTQKLEDASGGLSTDLIELENELNSKIETADTALEEKITNVETTLKAEIESNDAGIEAINTKLDEHTTAIADRATYNDIKPLLKGVAYDSETCTFTFTTYEGTETKYDLPLESTVKSGYYDEEFDNLVLVLLDDTEIKIPAAALIDIYTGSEGNQVTIEVSKDNVISAILKADSVDESFLTPEVRERLTTIETNITKNAEDIQTLNENAALYDASGDLPFRKDAILKINQKLLGSKPDGSTHVLAATLGWNIGTENEYIQNEFGSSTLHANLNSIDRPTIEMPTGKEEIAYKSELETAQADITAVKEEVQTIIDTEVASLKEKDIAIEASITTLEEKVDTSVEDLTNGISQNTSAIEANTASIEELETNKQDKLLYTYVSNITAGGSLPNESSEATRLRIGVSKHPFDGSAGTNSTLFYMQSKSSAVTFTQNPSTYWNINLVSENIEFDTQETGLTSTFVPAAIRELKGLVDTNTTSIADNKTEVDTEIAAIKTTLETNTTNITDLTTRVDNVENVIDTKLEPIEARITANETNIASNTKAIEDNKTAVDTEIANLKLKDTEIETSLATNVETLNTAIEAINADLENVIIKDNVGTGLFVRSVDFSSGATKNAIITPKSRNILTGETQTDRYLVLAVGGEGLTQDWSYVSGHYNWTVELVPEEIIFDPAESGLTNTAIPAAIREVKGLVDTNTTDIATININIASIDTRVTEAEANITTNTADIETLKTSVETNATNIKANATNIATNTESIAAINSSLEEVVLKSDMDNGIYVKSITGTARGVQMTLVPTLWNVNGGKATTASYAWTTSGAGIKSTATDQSNVNRWTLSLVPEAIVYDNSTSGLTSTTFQAAIDEVKGLVDTSTTNITNLTTRVSSAETKITNNTTAINERVTKTEAQTFIKDVAYDGETCTFTFTMYDGTTEEFDLPLESTVKSGYYSEDKKALVLVLMDDTEIEIPATSLIDVYTGAEGNQVSVSVSSANVISAILKADSIDESFLTEELRNRLTTIETNISTNTTAIEENTTAIADNKTALETVNTTLGNHTTEIAGIQEALANMEASAITFDNTDTDLTATNVQEALVEINNKIGDILTILQNINGTN